MSYVPKSKNELRTLSRAARLWGIQLSYLDTKQIRKRAKPKTLVKLLENLSDATLRSQSDLKKLCEQKTLERLHRVLEPVSVFTQGEPQQLWIFLLGEKIKRAEILTEGGRRILLPIQTLSLRQVGSRKAGNQNYQRWQIEIRKKLPLGYHRLTLFVGKRRIHTFLICSLDSIAKKPFVKQFRRGFGCFAPLYALKSQNDGGVGNFTTLRLTEEWTRRQGGLWIGSTPMLASNFGARPFDPSPYAALSKLFWNEVYLDVKIPKDPSEWVNYPKVYLEKSALISESARAFFAAQRNKTPLFKAFLKENPEALAYARFRAKTRSQAQFHLYAQYECARQLKKVKSLYLDYPVGVSRDGFDCAQFAKHFLHHTSAGAPPDALFMKGQNWGFYPMHPTRIREEEYRYFTQSLRLHCRHAALLRIDHVMGFHRIFAIPDGLGAKEGAYIRYRSKELYAILLLEAYRSQAVLVGEDLGTVPDSVRAQMKARGLKRLWVYEFEAFEKPKKAIKRIESNCMAGLDTHDTVPFAGFWTGADLEILRSKGFIDHNYQREKLKERRRVLGRWEKHYGLKKSSSGFQFLSKLLQDLSRSKADLLQVNLEDLWLERMPQNVPGTLHEYPNWQKRFALPIEEWMKNKEILKLMSRLKKGRRS